MWQFYLKILFINMNVCSQLLNLAKKEGGGGGDGGNL